MPAAPDPLAPLDPERADRKRKCELAAPAAVYRLPALDTSDPAFVAEARRQARAAANSPQAEEDQAWVDSISIFPDELFPEE